MRNRYKAQCFKCRNWFEKGQAYLHRSNGEWFCHCLKCYDEKHKTNRAQEELNNKKEVTLLNIEEHMPENMSEIVAGVREHSKLLKIINAMMGGTK